jgi:hypothetical protein
MQGVKNGRVQKGFIVEVALWEAAAAVCQKNKDSISEVLREGLRAYIVKNGGEVPAALIGVKPEKPAEDTVVNSATVEPEDAAEEPAPKPRRNRSRKPEPATD